MNSGTLLVNSRGDLGGGNVTVNNSGTLGGNTIRPINRVVRGNGNALVTVTAGGNLAPGNGGNNTAVFTVNALTLQPASNFRIDINGISAWSGYDRLVSEADRAIMDLSSPTAILWSQSARHCRSGKRFSLAKKHGGLVTQASLRKE